MGNIKKIELIDRSLLDEKHYLESLIEEALRLNLLTMNDVEKIQLDCLALLANKTERYNGWESSSVRVEVAQNMMQSNLYTIGLWLKTYPCPDDAIKALKESKLKELYENGFQKINSIYKAIKLFHFIVLKNMIDIDNYIYNATIVDGIKGFLKIYNPTYEAHEIKITADYPIYNPINNLLGIEFIQEYLNSVHYENMFCRNFSSEDIHHLLCSYDKNYKDLVINIYEVVLCVAVGCAIAKSDINHLNLSEKDINHLYRILSGRSRAEIESIAEDAFCKLKDRFQIKDGLQEQYMKKSLSAISYSIYNGINLRTLDKVFIIANNAEITNKVYFSFGEKMDNKKYCKVVEEIIQCRYLADKISVIKTQIKSLADLEDVLLDTELPNEEMIAILKELLNPAEIAALSKKYPFKSETELIDLGIAEQKMCGCLNEYIASLPPEQQIWIAKAIELLD